MNNLQCKVIAQRFIQVALLCIFVLALSTRTYSAWRRGFDHDPVQHPWTIVAGDSLAPHQYRVVYPFIWDFLSSWVEPMVADKILLFATIVACYSVLLAIYRKLMGDMMLACLGALAFLGTCMHPYQFQFRDTFLEVMMITLAFYLQSRAIASEPRLWLMLAVLSVLGTLNRETWLFVLTGTFLALFQNGIRPVWQTKRGVINLVGWLGMVVASGLSVLSTRIIWGIRPLYCNLWTWDENIMQLFFWRDWGLAFGHGIWGVGAGVVLIYVMTLLRGNSHHRLFIIGYLGPLLLVSFFVVARWIESRTFFPSFAILIAVIGMHIRDANAKKFPSCEDGKFISG